MTSPTASAGTYAPLPWPGVLELLRGWSGKGQLYAALAAPGSQTDDQWSQRDVERRARRVLFAELEPVLARWPVRTSTWADALPAESVRYRALETSPAGRVDWVATRLNGWPPDLFAIRHRRRQSDQLLTTVLKWTLTRLVDVRRDAIAVLPGVDAAVAKQIDAALAMLDRAPVLEAAAIAPSQRDLTAVKASGRPWRALANVTEVLLSEERDLEALARRMLLPDEDLRWRLFHLGCLGTMLAAVRNDGHRVEWLRPLGGTSRGPTFAVTDTRGRRWDVWFEAAAIWSWYGAESPYSAVRRSLPGAERPLGADLALVLPGEFALLVECKYSTNPSYVGRNGYEQALAYLAESRSGLVPAAASVVVGPESVVVRSSTAATVTGELTITSPNGVAALVRSALSRH